jgi:hypothetical protein
VLDHASCAHLARLDLLADRVRAIFLIDFLDSLAVMDAHGDEAFYFHAAYLKLVQPDQIVARQGGDALKARPIPDALTIHKPVRRTSL